MDTEIALRYEAILGEGALWDDKAQRLYWLDIVGKKLFVYDPAGGKNEEHQLPQMAGTVVPRASGGIILCMEGGIHAYDPRTGTLEWLSDPEAGRPETRYNDGKCDPTGRLWVGTMGRGGEAGLGTLYRVDADLAVHPVLEGVDISNGIAWSPDRKHMYWTGTLDRVIWGFDYNDDTGKVSNRRPAITVREEDGYPDGMTMDAEGMIWAAHWEGGRVIRYNPATGKKLGEIRLPVGLVSSCAFGGKNLDRLFITTARMGLGEEELARQPEAGSLFVADTGVRGIPAVPFAG